VIASTSSGIFVVPFFIVGFFFFIGVMMAAPLLGWLGVPVAIAHNIWAWRRATLWPISADSAKSSRQACWIVGAMAILEIFWS